MRIEDWVKEQLEFERQYEIFLKIKRGRKK